MQTKCANGSNNKQNRIIKVIIHFYCGSLMHPVIELVYFNVLFCFSLSVVMIFQIINSHHKNKNKKLNATLLVILFQFLSFDVIMVTMSKYSTRPRSSWILNFHEIK